MASNPESFSSVAAAGAPLSQRELIARAFSADDVEADFAAEKAADTEQELPSGGAAHPASAQQAVPPLQRVPATTCAEKAAQSACQVQLNPPPVVWFGEVTASCGCID